jgi:aminoglycoside 3-N-acetyltransferase
VSTAAHYCRADVVRVLTAVGVRHADVVFSHSSVAMLGVPDVGLDEQRIANVFLSAFREVAGDEGTWILPTYTYSYTKGEVFDPTTTPPTQDMGLLPNVLWRHPDASRSLDPIFSVIAIGPRAKEMTAGVPTSCFGEDCVYARLIATDGAVCNIGIGAHSALLHHVEQTLGVPYRYLKTFRGVSVIDGHPLETEITYNVRNLHYPSHTAYFTRLDHDGRLDRSVRAERLGRGEVNLIRARRMSDLARQGLARDPEYLVLGRLAHADD